MTPPVPAVMLKARPAALYPRFCPLHPECQSGRGIDPPFQSCRGLVQGSDLRKMLLPRDGRLRMITFRPGSMRGEILMWHALPSQPRKNTVKTPDQPPGQAPDDPPPLPSSASVGVPPAPSHQ